MLLRELQLRNRIEKFKTDFKGFCQYYFPDYFYVTPSAMHEQMFIDVPYAIDNNAIDNLAYAAPRGNAKSTFISFALPIWVAVYQKKHYVIIVSDSADQANDFLAGIKSEFEDNERLINDFGDMVGAVWTNSDLILSNNVVRIQALGVGKKIRGRRFNQWRPDLIICDDLENDENIQSPEQRQKMATWHAKALSKAGDERTDKIFVGTILHYDSLLSKLLKNPIYKSKKYQAVIQWSASALWDQWEKIIVNLENESRIADAKAFFEERKGEMLAGTRVLWPEKESYYDLMVQKVADGPAAFSSEKQNEPLSDDERRFLREWIVYYDDSELVGKKLFVVGFCDPSLGKKGGDYSAIITLASDYNYQIYVLDADMQKRHPDIIITDTIAKHRQYTYQAFGVEENQFQEYFKDSMKKKAEEMGVELPIKGIRQASDKILRIQSLQPDIKNARVKFRRDQQQLIDQLVNFPTDAHDDGPDALEGALALLGQRSAVADYYKEQAHESNTTSSNSVFQKFGIQGIIK